MVLTEEKLFTVGPPEKALTQRNLFAGEQGSRLAVVSTADGTLLKEFHVDALPT